MATITVEEEVVEDTIMVVLGLAEGTMVALAVAAELAVEPALVQEIMVGQELADSTAVMGLMEATITDSDLAADMTVEILALLPVQMVESMAEIEAMVELEPVPKLVTTVQDEKDTIMEVLKATIMEMALAKNMEIIMVITVEGVYAIRTALKPGVNN